MIKLDVTNFRIVQSAQLYDDTPLSVIMGYNEDGKTSLTQAMKFVLTGEAFGHRGKNIASLMTHGETKMAVRLSLGSLNVMRTQASGDTIVSVANRLALPVDVLPVLFDAKMAGDGGNKALKAFLDNVASAKFDSTAHFAAEDKVAPAIAAAQRAGKASTKHIIDYCESMRALSKSPSAPTSPTYIRPAAADVEAANQLVEARRKAVTEAEAAQAEANRLGQDLGAIVHHFAAVSAWEAAKAQAAGGDPISSVRTAYEKVAAVNVNTLEAMIALITEADIPLPPYVSQAKTAIVGAIGIASMKLAAYPLPPNVPAAPVLSAQAATTLASLGGTPARELLNTLSLQVAAAVAAQTTDLAVKRAEFTAAESAAAGLQRAVGGWTNYDEACTAYAAAVSAAEAAWNNWDYAAKAIQFAANEHTAKTGDTFGKLVAEMSESLLQGRSVKIDPDHGIFLGPEPIGELSESTRWRTEIAVMAAIGRACKSPLLLIDGADILDTKNRSSLFDWLSVHITPHFQHTILTATCRGDIADEGPIGNGKACKFKMSRGQLTKIG